MSFNVMLAKGYDPKRITNWEHIYVEPKLDGVRVIAFVGNESITYKSRNGRALEMFSHLDKTLRADADRMRKHWRYSGIVVFDGEMMGTNFGDISGAIHRKNATVKSTRFNPFIAMPAESFKSGVDRASQMQRLKQMHEAGLVIPAYRKAASHKDVQQIYASLLKHGYEGAMVKDYSTAWTAERSFNWMKMKEEKSLDLRIVGFKEGAGKYKGTLGALIVDYKGKQVPVSGMDDKLRRHVWENKKEYEGELCEVLYQLVTVHGSLRHPRFKRMRGDKS